MSQPSARPVRAAFSTAARLSVGSAPGWPEQTGQTCVFGSPPNAVEQAQKILLLVFISTWTSSPQTIS